MRFSPATCLASPGPVKEVPVSELDLYEALSLYRSFEEAVAAGVVSGEIHGEMHLAIGQETVAAAMATHLREHDVVVSTHRSHLHALAAGVDPVLMLAELFERDGLNHGKGGHMHLFDPGRRFMCTGIVGASAPLALGYALAQKLRRSSGLTVAMAGDGAMNQGGVLEAMNLASVRRLPVLFLVEDNRWSISVPRERSTAGTLAGRAAAFGIPASECDGRDAEAVGSAVKAALDLVRDQQGPAVLVVAVARFRGHYEGDPDLYRSAAEKDEQMSRAEDPVLRLEDRLRSNGTRDADLDAARTRAAQQVHDWLAAAGARPLPDQARARLDVFADV